jgi:type II secretory pathway pseudopilin PulG
MMHHGLLKEAYAVGRQSSIIKVVTSDCDPGHRSSMAGAFTLIELLMVVMVAPIVMISISGLYRGVLRDVPQTIRLMDQNTMVLEVLDQLRRDMDATVGVPEQAGDRRADPSTLLIGQADGVVCYRFEDGRTVRTRLGRQEALSPAEERAWQTRDAVIEWRPWRQEDKVRGVEVHSHLKQIVAGEVRRKFRSSHIFFAQSPAGGGQAQ